MKHSLFTFNEELLMLEKQYLTTISWNGLMCSKMDVPSINLSGIDIFELDGRSGQIAVSMGNGRFKYWDVIERAKYLMSEGVLVLENGCLYGVADSFAPVLKKVVPEKKNENERAERIRELYRLKVFTFEQALERLQVEFDSREKAAEYLAGRCL
ncbi:hypothetical protein ACOMCU_02150 [Lysinibacillus sp. UGB7]|uniref:hypothetical protein n=1 Tax=Lysinibacillus sp. UGB7 TaxID=3411039 RepID=UPI003B7AB3CE